MPRENGTVRFDLTKQEYLDIMESLFAKIMENRKNGISDMDDPTDRLFKLRYKLQDLWKMFPQ